VEADAVAGDFVNDFAYRGLVSLLFMLAPVMIPILAVGIVIGMIQAATSINDTVLSFLPKIVIALGCMAVFAPVIMSVISDYAISIFEFIPQITR
jgi:flagellar biosynthesis protein FliQ